MAVFCFSFVFRADVVLCLLVFLVVSTSAIVCLERLVSEMTYYVSSETLNPTHSLNTLSVIFKMRVMAADVCVCVIE